MEELYQEYMDELRTKEEFFRELILFDATSEEVGNFLEEKKLKNDFNAFLFGDSGATCGGGGCCCSNNCG